MRIFHDICPLLLGSCYNTTQNCNSDPSKVEPSRKSITFCAIPALPAGASFTPAEIRWLIRPYKIVRTLSAMPSCLLIVVSRKGGGHAQARVSGIFGAAFKQRALSGDYDGQYGPRSGRRPFGRPKRGDLEGGLSAGNGANGH